MIARALRFAAADPRVAWALASAHALAGLAGVAGDTWLNDEGLLTWIFASMTAADPVPILFFQKSRPLLSAIWAAPAAAGLDAFLVLHVLLGAATVPLVASVARACGQRAPNAAALIVAASPMLVAAGAAGVSNADAAAGCALVLLLLAKDRARSAGVVLGALLFARSELAVLAVALAAQSIGTRSFRRALPWIAVVPAVYALAGALYHRDLLWIAHYPPALPAATPGGGWTGRGSELTGLAGTLLAVTPAIGVALFARARDLSPIERCSAIFVALFVVALRVMPLAGVFNFDASPRYLLPVVPFVALLAGRGVAAILEHGAEAGARVAVPALAVLLVAGHFVDSATGSPLLLEAVALTAAIALAVRLDRAGVAVALVALLVLAGAPRSESAAHLRREQHFAAIDEVTHWLRTRHRDLRGVPVVTNAQILSTWLARSGDVAGLDVRYLVQADQEHEIAALTNARVGQRDAVWRGLESRLYGRPIRAEALDELPAGALFVLTDDARLSRVLEASTWGARLATRAEGRRWRIAELREAVR